MDSSIHMLIASSHAQEHIRKATGARQANQVRRESLTTSPTKPRKPWLRRRAPRTASIGTQR